MKCTTLDGITTSETPRSDAVINKKSFRPDWSPSQAAFGPQRLPAPAGLSRGAWLKPRHEWTGLERFNAPRSKWAKQFRQNYLNSANKAEMFGVAHFGLLTYSYRLLKLWRVTTCGLTMFSWKSGFPGFARSNTSWTEWIPPKNGATLPIEAALLLKKSFQPLAYHLFFWVPIFIASFLSLCWWSSRGKPCVECIAACLMFCAALFARPLCHAVCRKVRGDVTRGELLFAPVDQALRSQAWRRLFVIV